jgi:hypothetical protein
MKQVMASPRSPPPTKLKFKGRTKGNPDQDALMITPTFGGQPPPGTLVCSIHKLNLSEISITSGEPTPLSADCPFSEDFMTSGLTKKEGDSFGLSKFSFNSEIEQERDVHFKEKMIYENLQLQIGLLENLVHSLRKDLEVKDAAIMALAQDSFEKDLALGKVRAFKGCIVLKL